MEIYRESWYRQFGLIVRISLDDGRCSGSLTLISFARSNLVPVVTATIAAVVIHDKKNVDIIFTPETHSYLEHGVRQLNTLDSN